MKSITLGGFLEKTGTLLLRLKRLILSFLSPVFIRPEAGLAGVYSHPNKIFKCILVIKLSILLVTNLFFLPIALLLWLAKIKIVLVNVSQIGNYIWLDCFLKENLINKKKYRLIIVLGADQLTANKYLLSLYSSHVYIAKSVLEYCLWFPFLLNPICTDNLVRFDAGGDSLAIHQTLGNFGASLIKMSKNDIEAASREMQKLGLKPFEKFVAIHVRDSGFYGLKSQVSRNAEIHTYAAAVALLIDSGFKVVRLGDKSSADATMLSKKFGVNFIDYAHSEITSEEVDCYLMSNCDFLLGTDSGPAFVVPLFQKNVVMTNAMPPSRALWFLKQDVSIFKKLKYKETGSIVSIKNIMDPDLYYAKTINCLNSLGYEVEENNEKEIVAAVKEFLSSKNGNNISDLVKHEIKPGCRNYKAKGCFSYNFLKKNYSKEMLSDG